MSRTHRKHLAPGEIARRGPKNRRSDEDQVRAIRKPSKQRRVNERSALRREYR